MLKSIPDDDRDSKGLGKFLKSVQKGEELPAPTEVRRCRQITFRNSAVPFHVDGKVFDEIATPFVITLHPGALELVEI